MNKNSNEENIAFQRKQRIIEIGTSKGVIIPAKIASFWGIMSIDLVEVKVIRKGNNPLNWTIEIKPLIKKEKEGPHGNR
ncbi:hypothetical protein DRO69_00435 [Candidatus Bathyarchaeota archaeon]|nr:MAG: hypothetical protein DRO69_00435 [Candidatus Bathyarchaeota archaeon]